MEINDAHLRRLVKIEREQVHPKTPPSRGDDPFLVIERDSPILLSAPHGARTFRNSPSQLWHPHDKFTASLALLLSDLCGTSAIATLWRTDDHDPNYRSRVPSAYKHRLGDLLHAGQVRWVLDIHGLDDSASGMDGRFVDLGVRHISNPSLSYPHRKEFERIINLRLGAGTSSKVVSCNKRPARTSHTITSYVWEHPDRRARKVETVQVELKRCVRVPILCNREPRYDGQVLHRRNQQVIAAMQAIADFIEYLGNVR